MAGEIVLIKEGGEEVGCAFVGPGWFEAQRDSDFDGFQWC